MVEDTPAAIEHGQSKTCHGNCSRNGSGRGIYLRNSLSISSTSSMPCDRAVVRCPSTRPISWSLLRYAPHLNTEKLKVNKFMFGLNVNIRAKVRILMPQTLHDVVQKALIAEEELISGGQSRTPARPAGQASSGAQQHQTPARHSPGYRGTPERIHFHYTSMTNTSAAGLLTEDHNTSNNVDRNNNSLGMFSRTDQGSRPVGRQLLLQVPGVLDRRKGVGHVESHITSMTAQLRGPEHLDQSDPLPWEIWARPIGFMQR
jgi:hypothetical protein